MIAIQNSPTGTGVGFCNYRGIDPFRLLDEGATDEGDARAAFRELASPDAGKEIMMAVRCDQGCFLGDE
jgi:hypothetical protein